METIKIATAIGGHGAPMLYPARHPPSTHPAAPQIHPPTTRGYDGPTYKRTISPPIAARSTAYPGYGPVVDGPHGGHRYLQQPTYLPTYPRDSHYARPMTDRPVLMPHASRRPSIMGAYGGYKDMVQMLPTSTMGASHSGDSYKRIKLTQGMRADVRYAPLVIDTNENHTSREPSYYPQVEAISPTLPPDPRDESPLHSTSDDLIKQLEQVDKEISLIESSITNLKKKEKDLQAAAQKGESQSQKVDDDSKETKHQSTAQIIYAENRKKADEAHSLLNKLIVTSENIRVLPIYHQPSDCEVYQENKRKYMEFRPTLMEYFKRRQTEVFNNEQKLSQNYSILMVDWLRKVDKVENSKKHREKVGKSREMFEKVFPELRKQREDKERFSRVGARVKSDAEMEEIMDGLQEQENEDKKMRAYAVIPPIMIDEKDRKYRFINKNGLIEGPLEEYKEHKNVNIWNETEGHVFKEKYLQHPKNFVMIASYLEKKSVSDCIQHYYVTKKKENFKLMVKRRMRRPRTKASNQPQMEPIHLNPRVRTRGSAAAAAQKEIKTEQTSSSDSVPSVGTSATNADETMADLPINGAAIPSPSDSWPPRDIEDPASPMDVSEAATAAPVVNSIEVTQKDKENLNSLDNLQKRRRDDLSQECIDSSEEENSAETDRNGGSHCCFICKTRMDNINLSRSIKPSQAQELFALKEDEVTADARVCSNCRCHAVRRSRPLCQVGTCSIAKRKVSRVRRLFSQFIQLPPSIKQPIMEEFRIPNDDARCCQTCLMKIKRKMGIEQEAVDVSKWPEEDVELFKRTLTEVGCHWWKVCEKMEGKSEGQCKSFFNAFKEQHKLSECVAEYKITKGVKSDPPTVTDEEESGSSTSSCDETVDLPPKDVPPQVRHDSASDTLSASSPPLVNSIEGVKETNSSSKHSQMVHHPASREDYDSSTTTLSADECPIERDSPPEVEHIPHPGEKRHQTSRSRTAQCSQLNDSEILQDIISHTIHETLNNKGRSMVHDNRDITMETLLQPTGSFEYGQYDDCEGGLDLTVKKRDRSSPSEKSQPIPVPHSSTPQHNQRQDSIANESAVDKTAGSPPKAHSNFIRYPPPSDRYLPEFRKSPLFFSEPRTVSAAVTRVTSPLMVYANQATPRQVPVGSGSRVTSPLMVYNNQTTPRQVPPAAKLQKPSMAPPLPVAVSSPGIISQSQNSQRRPLHKVDKGLITIHGGSITRGTPVNQLPHAASSLPHPSRYDLIAKTVLSREGGSITQGTPIHHDSKRATNIHIKDNAILESRGGVEIIPRQAHEILSREAYRTQRGPVAPSSYSFTTYANYQTRPIYSDSQLTSREILKTDYMTSQQMPGRRGIPGEKEIVMSPAGRGPSPQGIKDPRAFPSGSVDRRVVDSMSAIVDRRVDQRKDMGGLELRPVDRNIISDRKVHIMRSSAGFVPVHNPQHYYHGDSRGSRSSNSPASVRETTPPTSETSHDYRIHAGLTAHALPHARSVIQGPNKANASIRVEPDRYSPHLPVISTGPDYVRRDMKQMEGVGGVMIGNRHMYDPRSVSREKIIQPQDDKRYGDRRERFPYKDAEDSDKMHSINYPIDMKSIQPPKQRNMMSDSVPARALIDSLIMKSISGRANDEAQRIYRRKAAHVYPTSEDEKRVRSPLGFHHKEKDLITMKDCSDISRSLKEGHSATIHPSMSHHVNLLKTSQAHIDSVINREFAIGLEHKKLPVSNHYPYGRPPLEITRTDARPPTHMNQYEPKMHSSGSMLYPIESEQSKDRYESKSPHRPQPSNSHYTAGHMSKDERKIIRIPQPQTQHSQNAFSLITNKLQQIWREDSPEKDRRSQEPSMSRTITQVAPQQRQISVPHHSPSGHMLLPQGIRPNSHFDEEQHRKRPRLELLPEGQRPPSRPRSSGTDLKDHGHREEVADSPQSGEMVIDENPLRENVMKMSADMADRPNSRSSDDKSSGSRSKPTQFQNPYHGYPPPPSNWATQSSLAAKNGRFQGYEPNVEPVSDDE